MSGGGIFVGIIVLIFLDSISGWGPTDGETTREVVGRWRPSHVHLTRRASDRGADGHGGGEGAVRSIETSLDQVLAFGLSDERLELCGSEGIY